MAAVVLTVHGLIEVSGLLMVASLSQSLVSFGGLGQAEIEPNAHSIVLFGVMWGLGRLAAAWGIWSLRKWAMALGLMLSLGTVITALSIMPAGVTDTLLAIPALVLILQAWFGREQVTQ